MRPKAKPTTMARVTTTLCFLGSPLRQARNLDRAGSLGSLGLLAFFGSASTSDAGSPATSGSLSFSVTTIRLAPTGYNCFYLVRRGTTGPLAPSGTGLQEVLELLLEGGDLLAGIPVL